MAALQSHIPPNRYPMSPAISTKEPHNEDCMKFNIEKDDFIEAEELLQSLQRNHQPIEGIPELWLGEESTKGEKYKHLQPAELSVHVTDSSCSSSFVYPSPPFGHFDTQPNPSNSSLMYQNTSPNYGDIQIHLNESLLVDENLKTLSSEMEYYNSSDQYSPMEACHNFNNPPDLLKDLLDEISNNNAMDDTDSIYSVSYSGSSAANSPCASAESDEVIRKKLKNNKASKKSREKKKNKIKKLLEEEKELVFKRQELSVYVKCIKKDIRDQMELLENYFINTKKRAVSGDTAALDILKHIEANKETNEGLKVFFGRLGGQTENLYST